MHFNTKIGLHKTYLQWFPFSKLSKTKFDLISSEEYFKKYIENGAFVLLNNFTLLTENYIQKNDGSFRNSSLISPLLYLVLEAIGKTIANNYNPIRQQEIFVYYAGNFKEMRCYYKKDYDNFFKKINSEIENYQYFIKTDIKDFFTSININKLIDTIDNNVNKEKINIHPKYLQTIKELLQFCGNGKFPIIENSLTASFLATIIYLDETDNKLFEYITSHITTFSQFKFIRYVDDLYILLSTNKNKILLNKTFNEIINEYSSLLKNKGLSLNTAKCSLKPVNEINIELKQSLYNEYNNGIKCEVEKLCPNGILDFITKLSSELDNNYISVDKYNQIINSVFEIKDIEFTPNEILNYFIYENDFSLDSSDVQKSLEKLIKKDLSFIYLDPKRLTILIMKSKSNDAIKIFLNQLFQHNKKGKWNSYDTTIAINYLIQSKFNHIDLLKIIKNRCPNLYSYFNNFCQSFNLTSNTYDEKLIEIVGDDKITWYLYFMYLIEFNRGNIISAFAYFKNFFDRVTAHLSYYITDEKVSKNPNYKKFYKENELITFYSDINTAEKKIKDAHILRNENPISHSSAELINKDSSTEKLKISIENLNWIIYNKLKIIRKINS